ncbi:MAG TPA: HAD family hydrolase, partial [Terriglobales bacterium]|nr:HAD family hydrolase [Terriglobales bacterium]
VDTAPDLTRALNHVLMLEGRALIDPETVRVLIGDGARVLIERAMAATGAPATAEQLERGFGDFLAYYREHIADYSRPFAAVTPTIDELSRRARLAVCTNKPEALSVQLLQQLELAPAFAAIVGGDSLPVRKPDPGHLLGTLAQLEVAAAEAVMVGDSRNDVLAARAAGIPVVAVSFGYTAVPPHQLGADCVIDSFEELPAVLAQL